MLLGEPASLPGCDVQTTAGASQIIISRVAHAKAARWEARDAVVVLLLLNLLLGTMLARADIRAMRH